MEFLQYVKWNIEVRTMEQVLSVTQPMTQRLVRVILLESHYDREQRVPDVYYRSALHCK